MAVRIEEYPLNGRVECDLCGKDFTSSDAKGGVLFVSKAVCAECLPDFLVSAARHGESHLIRGRCPEGLSFADWCRSMRGPDGGSVRIVSADTAEELFDELLGPQS